MSTETLLLIMVLLAGFYMAWSIGANDVANAMGTSVGSGALTLRKAIVIAAILEFAGAYFFGSHVSETVQNGLIDSEIFRTHPIKLVYGMLASLIAAGVWLQVASYYGWPVSTTHTIVGSIVGFGVVLGGIEAVYWENVAFIVSSWVVSPLFGGIISYFIFTLLRKKIFYSSHPTEAAIKLAPSLVLAVTTILSLIMIYTGLQNLHLNLNFFEALILSFGVGLAGYAISFLCLKKIKRHSIEGKASHHVFDPEIAHHLDKAKKNLQKAYINSKGELKYEFSMLIEEMNTLSLSLNTTEKNLDTTSEYMMVEKIFGYLQLMSACLMAFAHGANDVANAIGPLSAAVEVLTTGKIVSHAQIPTWALAMGGVGIVIGLATWGWRVIETIGKKITELTPTRGFAAEFGAATTVLIASRLGMPISTTHTLVGSVIGVGLARGINALDMRTTRDILISWLVTVPAGAALTVFIYFLIQAVFSINI
jgi:inorganic phosphate transporter, PiT family